MANTRAQQLALVNANLPNNTTKQITPVKHRQVESESITAAAFIDDDNTFSGINSHQKEVRWHKGVSLASAANIDLGNTGNFHHVTGAVEIETLSTKQHGTRMLLYFGSNPNLKHSANLILPGAVDIQTTAGALAEFISEGGGVWRLNSYAGRLPVSMGGTGQTSYTDGQLLIGNTATGGLSKATLTAGTNITITNGNGTITIAATGGGGGGVNTVGAFSATPQTNGATIAGSAITFGPASDTVPGMVSTAAQTFGGTKTFNASPAAASTVSIAPTTGSVTNAQLNIGGGTINWVTFGGGTANSAAPAVLGPTRSAGTKIVLYQTVALGGTYDTALGIESGNSMWLSSPNTIRFYAATGGVGLLVGQFENSASVRGLNITATSDPNNLSPALAFTAATTTPFISWGITPTYGLPTSFGLTRSLGTKIVLRATFQNSGGSDVALGVESENIMWLNAPTTIKFFIGITPGLRLTIDGDANNSNLTLTSASTVSLIAATATTANVFNTVATTVNIAGAATTLAIGNTVTAAQTVNMFTASTGASTYNFATGATANATTKTINIGTAGVSGSTTAINIGSAVSGATNTVAIRGNLTLGTSGGNMGFYGTAAIAKPTNVIAEAAFVANAGGVTVTDDSTFGTYTIRQVVQALQNLGLLT
jgi:hypothetical protein